MRYRPLLALLPALALLAGCGSSPTVTLCGGTETPLETPPAPKPGDPPAATALTQITVSGWRYPDTSVWIDGTEAVPIGCDRFWTATLDLPAEGDNTFTLSVKSRTLNPSPDATLTIMRDTLAPAAPTAVPASASTPDGTVTVTGTRKAGAEVRLNGRPVVPADGGTTYAVEVALAAGTNTLSFTAVDAAGNESTATVVGVDRTGTDLPAPRPIKPLDRQRLPLPSPVAITALWNNVVNPDVDHYLAEFADSPGFDPGGFVTTVASPDPSTLTATVSLPGAGRFYWRVGSVDTSGVVTYGRTLAFTLGPADGDVNGDGFSDVLAGLPGWDGGSDPVIQDNRGRVNLYAGGATLGSTATESPALQYDGTSPRGQFGISVTSGDLNGDGYADVAAGANLASVNARNAGQVMVFLGGASPDATADLVIEGQNFGDGFGQAVASGFDLNADGYADLAVSAWLYDDGEATPDAGRVYVFFGGLTPDGVPDLILTGGFALENFGSALAGNLDFNGDGYTDLAVGGPIAPAAGGTLADAGRVVVYYGGPWVDPVADLTLEGLAAEEHFGSSVTGAGDMDGDGFDDLAAGSPGYDVGANLSQGRVQVFRGGLSPATTPAVTLNGAGGCEAFGTRVSGGGDLNRDGYADLAVGIPFSDLGGPNPVSCMNFDAADQGAVEIHFGFTTLDNVSDARFTGEGANDLLGLGLHMTGDANGDGVPDLAFGAPDNDLGSSLFGDVGRGYVLFGRAGAAPWALQQSAATVAVSVQGAVLSNDGGKDGLGGAVW